MLPDSFVTYVPDYSGEERVIQLAARRDRPASVHVLTALALGVGLLSSCSEPTGPTRSTIVRVEPEWVTGAAAAGVDPVSRLFVLTPHVGALLTPVAAESAAVAYIRFALNPGTLSNARPSLEADRGAPVAAWDRLLPCGRTVLAETPFGTAPAGAPRNLVRYMRSAWSVTLCGPGGEPQVGVGVSDTRSGARFVGADYVLADIDSIGQMHIDIGLPRHWGGGLRPSPESAVGKLFQETGVPIAEVPRPRVYWAPLMTVAMLPLWELELASSVTATFETGDPTTPFTRVYARLISGDSIEFSVPSDVQPEEIWLPFPISFEPFISDSLPFAVVHPIAFRRVRFP